MSEYQYYEFRALDRRLTRTEMAELRAISTRAEISPSGFKNEYEWGSLKADPLVLTSRYFDAFVYITNWGTHSFFVKLPLSVVDFDSLKAYEDRDLLHIDRYDDYVIVRITAQNEDAEEWVEAEGVLDQLVEIRDEILRGDLGALYLARLAAISASADEEEAWEPPIPEGWGGVTEAQRFLAQFVWLDEALLRAATEGRASVGPPNPCSAEIEDWVSSLPQSDKNSYLVRLMNGCSGDLIRAELLKCLNESRKSRLEKPKKPQRRRIREIVSIAEQLRAEEENVAAAKAAAEKSERLARLAEREDAAWVEVESLIERKNSAAYDEAVTLLLELRELASRAGRLQDAEARIEVLRLKHRRKQSFWERLRAGT